MKRILGVLAVCLLTVASFGQRTYDTSFPGTGNLWVTDPNWITGGHVGLDWGDVQNTPAKAFGSNQPNTFGDATAVLTGAWDKDQDVTVTFGKDNTDLHLVAREGEVGVRTTLAAHINKGYEINCSFASDNVYIQLVKWDGPNGNGNFHYLAESGPNQGTTTPCANGTVFRVKVTGTNLQVWKDGNPVTLNRDPDGANFTTFPLGSTAGTPPGDTTVFMDGAPGFGFYDTQDSAPFNHFWISQFHVVDGALPGAPVITTQPVSQTVTVGQTAMFSIVATGATSYQWKKNNVNISGATATTY